MSIGNYIADIVDSRNTIRNKMIAAGQATINDKLSVLSTNLEIGTDTSDANAAASDIASGKTAYVNGEKIIGTMALATSQEISDIVNDIFSS